MPWLATVLIAVAGTFSAGVAGIARTAAGLPGAALPWPEGPFGLLTMVLLSVLTLGGVWAAVRPRQLLRLVLALHARTVFLLDFADRQVQTSRKAATGQRRPGRRRGIRRRSPNAPDIPASFF
jgi:competence protein ComEC